MIAMFPILVLRCCLLRSKKWSKAACVVQRMAAMTGSGEWPGSHALTGSGIALLAQLSKVQNIFRRSQNIAYAQNTKNINIIIEVEGYSTEGHYF